MEWFGVSNKALPNSYPEHTTYYTVSFTISVLIVVNWRLIVSKPTLNFIKSLLLYTVQYTSKVLVTL